MIEITRSIWDACKKEHKRTRKDGTTWMLVRRGGKDGAGEWRQVTWKS